MATTKARRHGFAEQQDALTTYLQDLLTESSESDATELPCDPSPTTFSDATSESASHSKASASARVSHGIQRETALRKNTNSTADPPMLAPLPAGVGYASPGRRLPGVEPVNDDVGPDKKPQPLKAVLLPQSFFDSDSDSDSDADAQPVQGTAASLQELSDEQAPDSDLLIPPWAQTRFQCLKFSMAGLTFAAPLEKLNGIIEWPAHITVLPGHADWFLGLYRNRGQNVQVIDLSIVLNRQPADGATLAKADAETRQQARYIMLVDEGRFGLASDSVANMLTLEPTEVKWRNSGEQRSIVVGTVIDEMCSILDIDALVELILRR